MKTSVALLLSSAEATQAWREALSLNGLGGYGFDPGKRDPLLALRSLLKERRVDAAIIDTSFFATSSCESPRELAELRGSFPNTRLLLRIPGRVHVSPAEQQWAAEWGVDAVLAGTPPAAAHRFSEAPVAALLRALSIEGATSGASTSSRELADLDQLERVGLDPIVVMSQIRGAGGVQLDDRIWRGTTYRECFVASEAVETMERLLGVDYGVAIIAGRALQSLGLLHHVALEQPFANDNLFFRFSTGDEVLGRLSLTRLLREMRGNDGVGIRDRRYLGKPYPRTFVGREAIDWLRARCGLGVGAAQDLGQRMIELGLLHHVVDEHPFLDAAYFYRFLSDER
ncbi:MAG: hypothetical protein ABIQ72_16065 [Usitatibacter sp.]